MCVCIYVRGILHVPLSLMKTLEMEMSNHSEIWANHEQTNVLLYGITNTDLHFRLNSKMEGNIYLERFAFGKQAPSFPTRIFCLLIQEKKNINTSLMFLFLCCHSWLSNYLIVSNSIWRSLKTIILSVLLKHI